MGPGGATSLLDGLAQVVEAGIVAAPDPMCHIFCEYLERRGFELLAVPEDDEGIRVDLLEEGLASLGSRRGAVRFFHVPTVGNPTGTILSNVRRRALVEAVGMRREAARAVS